MKRLDLSNVGGLERYEPEPPPAIKVGEVYALKFTLEVPSYAERGTQVRIVARWGQGAKTWSGVTREGTRIDGIPAWQLDPVHPLVALAWESGE